MPQVKELALQLDYGKFLDPGPVERVPLLGPSLALLRGIGNLQGATTRTTGSASQLRGLGVTTFGDLAIDDDELPAEQRYRLVVTVTDVTTGQLVRLPWDYRRVYGLDPDEQSVADAVRASMSIPFFFRPVTLTSAAGRTSTLVDGGLLSNFPIDSLDRPDGKSPRWPSFGVTVLPNLPDGNDKVIPALAALRLLGAAASAGGRHHHRAGRPRSGLSESAVGRAPAPFGWTRPRSGSSTSTSPTARSRRSTPRAMRRPNGSLPTWNWAAYLRRFR